MTDCSGETRNFDGYSHNSDPAAELAERVLIPFIRANLKGSEPSFRVQMCMS